MAADVLSLILRFFQDTSFVILLYELVICTYILRRRRRFALRLLVFIPYLALTNHAIGLAEQWDGYLILNKMHFGYLLCFLLSVLLVWFCYEGSASKILYFCTAAYIVENFGSQVGNIINLVWFHGSSVVLEYNDPRPLIYLIVREFAEIPIFLLFLFVFVKRYKRNSDFHIRLRHIAAIEISTLTVIIFLNYYGTMHGDMNAVTRIYAAIVDVVLLFFQFIFFNETRLLYENDLINGMLTIQAQQHQLSKDNIETINIKCHDLKRQINALRYMGSQHERENAIAELEQAIGIYNSSIKTGNETLDIVLMEKMLLCMRDETEFSCLADGSLLSFMSPVDIYILFSNALENAMECVRKYDRTKRMISLKIERLEEWFRITVTNYCSEALRFSDGLPITTKENGVFHGYGTKSVKMIAEKYGGTVAMRQQDELFILNILLPLKTNGIAH